MDDRSWEQFLIPYEQAVEELKVKFRSIRKELKKRNEYSPIEFVTGRIKKISSILEKAHKLNVPLDQLEEIEDITGIRIMCQFVQDIERVVELVHQRSGKDMTIVYEKDYINNQKPSGYRSHHIIIRYPVQTAHGEKEILAEIQIRTLAMNFWATIEHSLSYKYEGNIPDDIRERLRTTAEAAHLLDTEMSEIRDEIRDAQQMFEYKSNMVSRILQGIENLYQRGFVVEATAFQNEFREIRARGDVIELRQLSRTIQAKIIEVKRLEKRSRQAEEEKEREM
ncbi:GTP pyrophosphokinase [Aneurinibacillus uraniidurans]|uniref:GTP pyrophosphokinase n=1 Tax=Aneurinibacillus uraniidurans TaxID=2966586 RepID=UPI00234B69D4|nr:GTP pyrophosphokinase family protein [Aneurinibacillus sp. B1]WCN36746.1 GTP pyrophosphokinase family protein [Aneurinibacillus sp. B1]